jgi:hypothetical protein
MDPILTMNGMKDFSSLRWWDILISIYAKVCDCVCLSSQWRASTSPAGCYVRNVCMTKWRGKPKNDTICCFDISRAASRLRIPWNCELSLNRSTPLCRDKCLGRPTYAWRSIRWHICSTRPTCRMTDDTKQI